MTNPHLLKYHATVVAALGGLGMISASVALSYMDVPSKLAGLGILFLLIAAILFVWKWEE